MSKVDENLGLGAVSAVPALGTERSGDAGSSRIPIVELLVVGLLLLLIVPTLIIAARNEVSAQASLVTLKVSSDPAGAAVILDDLWVGRTPIDLELARGEEVALRVVAEEPFHGYDLYKPYRTRITLEENSNISVWIPRTTAEEQAAQRAARGY